MSLRRLAAPLLAAAAAIAGPAQPGVPARGSWPAGIHDVPAVVPALPPAAALRTFSMPPGYRLELVASEPLVQDPVAIDWDPDGRLWVVELPGYMRTVAGEDEREVPGRIVVLADRDGDGVMDSRTVFADGLVLPRAVKVLDRGVLVGEPPHVWLMADSDGDGRADQRTLVTDQYGRREIDPQNNANAFNWGLDNVIHTAGQSDVSLRLRRGAFEVHRTLRRGQWGASHDDAGRLFRNTNESALHVDLVPTAYYARHPGLVRTRGSYERLADDNPDLNTVWPIRPTPATNRAYQTGILREDGSLARFTAVCAPLVYRGDRLPADLRGDAFVAEPAANLVSRIVLRDDGTTIRARKAYDRGEFLASTDERFRPVFLANAPDGLLYIVDFYRGILEHRLSMTEYLRDRIVARRLDGPVGMGRIYRVVHETTRRDAAGGMARAPAAELVAMLGHPNGWRRDTAQRLLVERGGGAAVPALAALVAGAGDVRARLHALWTLDGLEALAPAQVERALADPARDVRAAAVRLAERWLVEPGHPLAARVLARRDDADWAVRRQLAASIGALPAPARAAAAAGLLDAHGGDPVVVDAVISSLRGVEEAVLSRLVRRPGRTPAREASVTMLAATIVRSAREEVVHELFAWTGEAGRAAWLRSALLRGAEVALLAAPMPGTPPGRGAAATPGLPCPTCPGARGGPGGAYAYPRPVAAPVAGGSAGLTLNREPVTLTALTADWELGSRAASVVSRIAWPGKAGRLPMRPLTEHEQRRFAAGRDLYRNVCQSCHQPDGRGQDRLAPALVDAAWTLAPPDIPARILLHGKEGAFGLMPPIGATLSDEQIAAVLTYVRREWGQGGMPVDPASVAAVRALTAGRVRPWTDAELRTLAGPQP